MSDVFKQYVQNNLNLLDAVSILHGIQCIRGTLTIQNNTYITNQPYLIDGYLSNLVLENSTIHNITSNKSVFLVVDTEMTISNTGISNLHTSDLGNFMQLSFDSIVELVNITYTSSTMKLLESLSSKLHITNLSISDISLGQYLIDYNDCQDVTIENVTIQNINTTQSYMMYVTRSSINLIKNITIHDIDKTVMYILNSNISSIHNLRIYDVTDGVSIQQSSIGLIQDSQIYRSGSTSKVNGGAIYIQNSNSTMLNMTFENNIAQSGGAISIICDSYEICQNTITNSIFLSNIGVEQGGAIYYSFRRPELQNITFNYNNAQYGPNIASYPVRIVNSVNMNNLIVLSNVASGLVYQETIRMLLVDYDSQTMNLISDSQIKILPVTSGASLQGVDYSVLTNGEAEFANLQFVYSPGQNNIEYLATCDLIDSNKISYLDLPTNNSIDISFRYCQPGEIVIRNQTCTV